MPNNNLTNASVLGRLLEGLSWVGNTIRNYREGGRGYENVLTAEALQGLDFLPRKVFFGEVIANARGADNARAKLISEIEEAEITLLPDSYYLIPSGSSDQKKLTVQPDGMIISSSCFVVLEAKRIRSSSFQPEQLAREFVLAMRDSGNRQPLLFLILGDPPPVKVQNSGKMDIDESIDLHLQSVLDRAEGHSFSKSHLMKKIPEVVCWITWHEISDIVKHQIADFDTQDSSLRLCIDRLANSVTQSIEWHE